MNDFNVRKKALIFFYRFLFLHFHSVFRLSFDFDLYDLTAKLNFFSIPFYDWTGSTVQTGAARHFMANGRFHTAFEKLHVTATKF